MPQLTVIEWAVVAAMFVAFGLVLFLMRRRSKAFEEFVVHGPAISLELQQVFGSYSDAPVEGLIVMPDGIHVGYKHSRPSIRFVPVIDGATLYWRDGKVHVDASPVQ